MKLLLPPTNQIIVNLSEKSLLQACFPLLVFIKQYQEHISFAEILTLSQLAGISYHRAIDWTHCTTLRDQSHRTSTVLKHTVFAEDPRPMKHCNTIKYKSVKKVLIFIPIDDTAVVTLTHQYPDCMTLHHFQSGFFPPVVKIKKVMKRYASCC